MSNLQLSFSNSSNVSSIDKGGNNPTWLSNNSVSTNKNNWYYGDYYYYYNLVEKSETNHILYFQYGQNDSGYATCRFVKQEIEILSQTLDENNYLNGKIIVKNMFYRTRKTDYAIGNVRVKMDMSLNGINLYNYTGDTATEHNWVQSDNIEINFNIAPEETSDITMILMNTVYPNGEFINTSGKFGLQLYNPNPKTYIPYAIRQRGNWKSLNSISGHIKIRKSSNWVDKSQENTETSKQENKGHNRIRQNNKWLQCPKM